MSPNDIEVLIHYYGTRIVHPRLHAPAVREATDNFLAAGLIEGDPDSTDRDVYRTTSGGDKLIKMLCATPWPEKRWVDPREDNE